MLDLVIDVSPKLVPVLSVQAVDVGAVEIGKRRRFQRNSPRVDLQPLKASPGDVAPGRFRSSARAQGLDGRGVMKLAFQ
jgi:hypothetical protein